MGLTLTESLQECDINQLYWVTFETGECKLALHGGGSENKGPGAPKFVFLVNNVPDVRTELITRGVVLGELRSPAPGVVVCDGKDPEGNAFSIESRTA